MKQFVASLLIICALSALTAKADDVVVYTNTSYRCGDLTRPVISQFKIERAKVDALPLINLKEHFEILPADDALNLVLEDLKQTAGHIQEYKIVERRSAAYRQQLNPGQDLGLPFYYFEIYSYHDPSADILKQDPSVHRIIERNSYVVLPDHTVIRAANMEATTKLADASQ